MHRDRKHFLTPCLHKTLTRLLLPALLLLNGCSLLTVNLKAPDSNCDLTVHRPSGCTTDESLKYAALWREKHLKAAGQHSVARNLNALLGLPAGAVGAFYGISGHGSTDRITRLALGSATMYGTTSLLAPQGKQRAYLEGALALSCVMDATLSVRRDDEELALLLASMQQVGSDHANLDALIRQYSKQIFVNSPVLARAAVARDNADNLLVRARAVRTFHENVGLRAVGATDRIVTQTAMLVSRHESNLESLLATASALRNTAGSFGLASLPATAAPDASTASGQSGSGTKPDPAAVAIAVATEKLAKSTDRLLVHVKSLELPAAEAPSYKLCALNDLTTDFSVLPAEAAQSVTVGGTLDFHIKNTQSNAFPSFSVTGAKADAVVVSGPLVKNGKLVITVEGKTATGAETVELIITDPSGNVSKAYRITVLPAEDAATAPVDTGTAKRKTTTTPPAGFVGTFSASDIKQLQCRLGLTKEKSDGVLGPTTYSALVKFAVSENIVVGPQLSQKLFDEVMKQPDQCVGAAS